MIKVDAKSTPTFFNNLKRRPCDKMGFVPPDPLRRRVIVEVVIGYGSGMRHLCKHLGRNLEKSHEETNSTRNYLFFLHIFSGRIEKGSVASRRAWHFDSCCSVCSFVHVGSLRACTDSRQTHVPALARRCKTHDTGAIKLSFSLAD